MTWPDGKQKLSLNLTGEAAAKPTIESIDFESDGRPFYLGVLGAPGIWHKEDLAPSYLEKDVTSAWKRPFPAKWVTQLEETGVRTTFPFREAKAEVWRGVPGSYHYPVWFSGDEANFHLGKKVPPKGTAVIYFLEGASTPVSMMTPVDILKATVGRALSAELVDLPGRKLRTHHRRGAEGVRRACTCGCTEAIESVFQSGEEAAKKDYVEGAVGDMVYFVQRHVGRIDEYRRFAEDMSKFLQSQAADPDLKPLAESLDSIVQQIQQEYAVQKENMKSLDYASGLARQTVALAGKKDAANLAAYQDLGKAWRAMGGAQDYVLAQCHMIARKLLQEAGYQGVGQPKTMQLAGEVIKRCKQCLRNPDGYEIWPDY